MSDKKIKFNTKIFFLLALSISVIILSWLYIIHIKIPKQDIIEAEKIINDMKKTTGKATYFGPTITEYELYLQREVFFIGKLIKIEVPDNIKSHSSATLTYEVTIPIKGISSNQKTFELQYLLRILDIDVCCYDRPIPPINSIRKVATYSKKTKDKNQKIYFEIEYGFPRVFTMLRNNIFYGEFTPHKKTI